MANPRSSRKIINALVCKDRNVKREYVYLDNLRRFIESCDEPEVFEVVFNDKVNAARISIDGDKFLETNVEESWVH